MVTRDKNKLAAPVVKWAGGKRQLLDEIAPLLPEHIDQYCEPFVGGGALLFALQPASAVVNDLNSDLINVYETIKCDLEALIASLKEHENTVEYFYKIRNLDRDKEKYNAMSNVDRASRLLYLNKTCFNGLFRVNSNGEFNTPFGHYKNPNIVNESVLRSVSYYFNNNDIKFFSEDFSETLHRVLKVPRGSFVYLDPPYDPVSDTASFTGYNKGGFDQKEQIRLKECCDELNQSKVNFMLSNSATNFICDLYQDYNITFVEAKRAINADATKRGAVKEVLIRNYGEK